jgi:GNAT superfamily N-acetyltransferase
MPISMTIRAARTEDADRIADVLIRSRKAFLPYAKSTHSDDETHSWVASHLLATDNVLVAVEDESIVGVIATHGSETSSWISQMYLSPEWVGRGIGTLLIERALIGLARPVRLHTFQANVRARRFYERIGFVLIQLSDGSENEERCPSALYELAQLPELGTPHAG